MLWNRSLLLVMWLAAGCGASLTAENLSELKSPKIGIREDCAHRLREYFLHERPSDQHSEALDAAAVAALIAVVQTEQEHAPYRQALLALGESGRPEARAPLLAAVRKPLGDDHSAEDAMDEWSSRNRSVDSAVRITPDPAAVANCKFLTTTQVKIKKMDDLKIVAARYGGNVVKVSDVHGRYLAEIFECPQQDATSEAPKMR